MNFKTKYRVVEEKVDGLIVDLYIERKKWYNRHYHRFCENVMGADIEMCLGNLGLFRGYDKPIDIPFKSPEYWEEGLKRCERFIREQYTDVHIPTVTTKVLSEYK